MNIYTKRNKHKPTVVEPQGFTTVGFQRIKYQNFSARKTHFNKYLYIFVIAQFVQWNEKT